MATFSRAMRMNKPSDYTRVFRQAKRAAGGGLTVLTVENTVGQPRLGLAIAKKHLKFAYQRNRLKRIIRASFRDNQTVFANIDIVVLSRPDVLKKNSAQIWAALEEHWLTVAEQWQKKS